MCAAGAMAQSAMACGLAECTVTPSENPDAVDFAWADAGIFTGNEIAASWITALRKTGEILDWRNCRLVSVVVMRLVSSECETIFTGSYLGDANPAAVGRPLKIASAQVRSKLTM
jgi:hypothetical protein